MLTYDGVKFPSVLTKIPASIKIHIPGGTLVYLNLTSILVGPVVYTRKTSRK